MKKSISLVLCAVLFLVISFLVVRVVAHAPRVQTVNIPEVADGVFLTPKSVAQGFEYISDEVNGYAIAFPETTENPLKEDATLPDAIGGKTRKFSFEVLKMNDARLNEDYCYTSLTRGRGKKKNVVINGRSFCLTDLSDPGAGSVFREYAYTTELENTVLLTTFYIRYPTTVKLYEGCEKDADATKQECIDLAFDEKRDTALFTEILGTLNVR